jgi:integrase
VTAAARANWIGKRATSQALRQLPGTHLLESGADIRTVQQLLGDRDVSNTTIYANLLNRRGLAIRSQLDAAEFGRLDALRADYVDLAAVWKDLPGGDGRSNTS